MALRPEAIMNMENSIQNAATKKMMNNSNGEGEPKPKYKSIEEAPFLSPQKMQEWNSFLDYAREKKFAGSPELDKEGKGDALFNEWKKANPKVSISMEDMPSVRKSLIALRDRTIDEIKAGKAEYKSSKGIQKGESADVSELMRHIPLNESTKNPNYIGQHMTITKFPSSFVNIRQKETGEVIGSASGGLRNPAMQSGQQMAEAFKKAESSKQMPKQPL